MTGLGGKGSLKGAPEQGGRIKEVASQRKEDGTFLAKKGVLYRCRSSEKNKKGKRGPQKK